MTEAPIWHKHEEGVLSLDSPARGPATHSAPSPCPLQQAEIINNGEPIQLNSKKQLQATGLVEAAAVGERERERERESAKATSRKQEYRSISSHPQNSASEVRRLLVLVPGRCKTQRSPQEQQGSSRERRLAPMPFVSSPQSGLG